MHSLMQKQDNNQMHKMIYGITLYLVLFTISSRQLIAQNMNHPVRVIKDVEYGKAEGYWASYPYRSVDLEEQMPKLARKIYGESTDFISLSMDIYKPALNNKNKKKYPLVVMAHDGAMLLGDKADETMVVLANFFAGNEIIVSSINYRLGFPLSTGMFEKAVYHGVQDMRAAIRFLVEYADDYNIDTDNIFVLGASAGGFIAIATAFMSEDERPKNTGFGFGNRAELSCLDCSTNFFDQSFHIKGIINLWGAIHHLSYISADDDVAILSFHGADDDVVPLGYDYPYSKLKLGNSLLHKLYSRQVYGSNEIHIHASQLGIKSEIRIFKNKKHSPHLSVKGSSFTKEFETIKEGSLRFIKHFEF